MALYETIFVSLFLATSLTITLISLYAADQIWTLVDTRETGAAKDGAGGVAVSMMDVFKMGTLGFTATMATWITAYSLGNTVDELVGWFDDWTDPSHDDSD